MLQKIGVNMPGLSMDRELISCPVPAMKVGQAPNRQHRAKHMKPSTWSLCLASPTLHLQARGR